MSCEKAHTFGNWDTKEKLSSCLLWPSSYFVFIVLEECNRWASYFLSINTSDICLICLAAEHRTTNQKNAISKMEMVIRNLGADTFFWKVNFPFMSFLNFSFSCFLYSFGASIQDQYKNDTIRILEKKIIEEIEERATIFYFLD